MQEQSWDYLHIVFEDGRPRYVNGKEIPNWQQGPTVFHAVNYLLWNGWELVDNPLVVMPLWKAYRPERQHFRRPKSYRGSRARQQ